MKGDKVILASGCIYDSDTGKSGVNNNQIIVGGSGSGKTMSITEPCLLYTQNRNLIVTVTKKRIVDQYKPILEKRGYNVEILDFAFPENSTVGYDPLKFVKTEEDIIFLARSIVLANANKQNKQNLPDPYWDESAISLVSALIGLVKYIDPLGTFADVMDKYKNLKIDYSGTTITTNLDRAFDLIGRETPDLPAVAQWKSFSNLPPRTASCIMSSLSIAIKNFFSPKLCDVMRLENQVDFKKIAGEKTILFIVTSPVNHALNNIVSIFYTTALKELFEYAENRENRQLPIPMHIICDDFATGAPIPDFAQYISIIREKLLSVTILCQSESQLESMYSAAEATTIINNCDSYVYTGSMDMKTAGSVGERINKPADEILCLPIGTFIVFRRGDKPKKVLRYQILEDPEYQKLYEDYYIA